MMFLILYFCLLFSSTFAIIEEKVKSNSSSPDIDLVMYLFTRGFPFRELIKQRLLSLETEKFLIDDDLLNDDDLFNELFMSSSSSESNITQENLLSPILNQTNTTIWWHKFISPESQIVKYGLQLFSKFHETRQWIKSATTPTQLSTQMMFNSGTINDARASSSVEELRKILTNISNSSDTLSNRRRHQGEALVLLSQWRLFFDSVSLPLSALFEAIPQELLNVSNKGPEGESYTLHSLHTIDDALRCMAAGVSLMHDNLIQVYSNSERMARVLMQEKQEELRKQQEEDLLRETFANELLNERRVNEGVNEDIGSPLSPTSTNLPDMELVQSITNWVSLNPGKPWPSEELLMHLSLEFDLNALGLDTTQAIFDFIKSQVGDLDMSTTSHSPIVVKPEDEFGNAYIFLNNRGEIWQPPLNLYVNGPYLSPTADDVSSIGAELFIHTSLLPENERKSYGIQGFIYEDGLTILSLFHLSRLVVRSKGHSTTSGLFDLNKTVNETLPTINASSNFSLFTTLQKKLSKSIESLVIKEESTFQRYSLNNSSSCILRLKTIPSNDESLINKNIHKDRARLNSANRVDISLCPQLVDSSPIFSSDEEALNVLSSLARRGIQVAQLAIGSRLAEKMYVDLEAKGVYPSQELVIHDEVEWITVVNHEETVENNNGEILEVQYDSSGQIIDTSSKTTKHMKESRIRIDRKLDWENENLPSCLASMRMLLPLAVLAANDNKAVSRAPDNLSPLWELHEDSMVSNLAVTEPLNVDFLRAQADAGDPDAALHMADLLVHGNAAAGLHQDNNRAFEWMSAAARGGNARASVQRAIMMIDSIDDTNVHRNLTEAIEILKAAADSNDVEAMAALGFVYQTGRGAERNLTLSLFYLKKAANYGMTQAHSNLAALYLTGDPADPSIANASAAREHLFEALTGAMSFNEMHLFAPAAYNLGLLELHGWDRSDGRGSCMRALPLLKSVASIGPWVDDSVFSLTNAFSRASRGGRLNDESAALQYLLLSTIGVDEAADNAAFLIERGVLANNLDVASTFLDKVGLNILNEIPNTPQLDRDNLLVVDGGSVFTTEFREFLLGLRFHETQIESNLTSHTFTIEQKEIARGLLNRKRLESLRHRVFDNGASYLKAPQYLATVPVLFGKSPLLQFVRTFGISQATSGLTRITIEAEMEGSNVDSNDWTPLIFSKEEWNSHEQFEKQTWNEDMEKELGNFEWHSLRQRALNWLRGKDSSRGVEWEEALVEYLDYESLAAADYISHSSIYKNSTIEDSLLRSCNGADSNNDWSLSLNLNPNMMAYALYSDTVKNAHSTYRRGVCFAEKWPGVPQCSTDKNGGEIARKLLEKASKSYYAHATYLLASAYDTGVLGKHSLERNFSEAWRLLDQCLALDPLATFPVTAAKAGLAIKWIFSMLTNQKTEKVMNDIEATLTSDTNFIQKQKSLFDGLWDCLLVWPIDDINITEKSNVTFSTTRNFLAETLRSLSPSLDANADGNIDIKDIQEALENAKNAQRDATGKRFMIGPFPASFSERTTCSVIVRATAVGLFVGALFCSISFLLLFVDWRRRRQ
jgi:TPR repeat protein